MQNNIKVYSNEILDKTKICRRIPLLFFISIMQKKIHRSVNCEVSKIKDVYFS